MVRDILKENEEIRNGNRYIIEDSGSGVLPRDVDKLFIKYTNLRNTTYNENKVYLHDEATKKELRSYINEEFVKLVKEYEINGNIDFPGYIKKKLPMRVKGTFLKKRYKELNRELIGTTDDEVEFILNQSGYTTDLSDTELLKDIFKGVPLTDIEIFILITMLSQTYTDNELVNKVRKKFPSMKKSQVIEQIEELRFFITNKLRS